MKRSMLNVPYNERDRSQYNELKRISYLRHRPVASLARDLIAIGLKIEEKKSNRIYSNVS